MQPECNMKTEYKLPLMNYIIQIMTNVTSSINKILSPFLPQTNSSQKAISIIIDFTYTYYKILQVLNYSFCDIVVS